MTENNSIRYHLDAGVATITLNRPEVFNSFNREMALLLQEHLRVCAQSEEVRAVVLTGEGKAFCAGQDLAEATAPDSPKISEIVVQYYNPIILLLRQLEKPVIAAVNGVAAGAGANVALACDIVVARESAAFIQAFSKIGLIPDSGGTWFLPRLVGLQRASALMMTGDKISAQEAREMGLVYKVFADAAFAEEVQQLAQKMAQMPTRGLAFTKQLLNHTFNHSLEEQLHQEAEYQDQAGNTRDFMEGVQAFLDKRKPNFTGQ
jgi:2-(1,2-epoxy-1,2-dihydrophenyl)acetyl-CoA isomerase